MYVSLTGENNEGAAGALPQGLPALPSGPDSKANVASHRASGCPPRTQADPRPRGLPHTGFSQVAAHGQGRRKREETRGPIMVRRTLGKGMSSSSSSISPEH